MLSVALALALAASAAPTSGITPEMEAQLQKGLDGIYSMDFDGAEAAARKVTELNPEHPHGWFGVAAATMMRYVYETEQGDPALIKLFEERMEFAAKKAKAWIEAHPDDAEAMMIYGACYGVRSRLQIVRKQWVSGYFSARKAIGWQRAALKKDPKLYDAYLGIGMYDYYTDVYPSVIGVLSKIMLRGNRLRGVAELKIAAEKGRFSNVVADLLLVEIGLEDLYGLRDPAQAVARMEKLRKRYPDSAMLHAAEISALYEAERWDDAKKGSEEYLARVRAGKYRDTQRPKGYVLLGHALWQLGRVDEALTAFQDGAEEGKRYGLWSLIRQAQLMDALGRREQAVLLYKRAAERPDSWDMRKYAESGLRRAYLGKPRSVSPLDTDKL
jgi:tetratricopeptide (TPR) repeat protein